MSRQNRTSVKSGILYPAASPVGDYGDCIAYPKQSVGYVIKGNSIKHKRCSMNTNRSSLLVLLSYAAIYLVWGSTYFAIKLSVETMPPLLVVGGRWLIGGAIFLAYAAASRGRKALPSAKGLWEALFMSVFLILVPNFFVTSAEKKVESYLAAVIVASVPIVVAFFDRFILKKRISKVTLTGMLAGMAGVALLVYNGNSFAASFSPEVIMLIAGIFAWSFGTSVGHKFSSEMDTVMNTGYQMTFAGIMGFTGIILFQPQAFGQFSEFSARSVAGFLYLAVIGSVTFGAYNYLLKHEPAVRIVSYALINPVIAVLLGMLLGNEQPVRYFAIGLPFVLAGLALMLYGDVVWKKVKPALFSENPNVQ